VTHLADKLAGKVASAMAICDPAERTANPVQTTGSSGVKKGFSGNGVDGGNTLFDCGSFREDVRRFLTP